MQEIKVLVPEERVAEFYQFFGAWLAGAAAPAVGPGHQVGNPEVEVAPWGQTEEDLGLAQVVWEKLSERAQAMFEVLMESPGEEFSGEALAEQLSIPNGKYGVAGVLAWPGRHSYGVGRELPVRYRDGVVGESANYWMTEDVAELFKKAKGQSTAAQR
jgi:hypothetical protein